MRVGGRTTNISCLRRSPACIPRSISEADLLRGTPANAGQHLSRSPPGIAITPRPSRPGGLRRPIPPSHWRHHRTGRSRFAANEGMSAIMPDFSLALFRPHATARAAFGRRAWRLIRSDADRRPADRLHASARVPGRALSGQSQPGRGAGAESLRLGRRPAGNPGRRHRRRGRRDRRPGGRGPRRSAASRPSLMFTAGFAEMDDAGEAAQATAWSPSRARHGMRILGPNCLGVFDARRSVLRDVLLVVRQRLAGAGPHRHRQPVRRLRHASLHAGAQPRHRRLALHHDRQRGRRHGRRMHRLAGGKSRGRRDRRLRSKAFARRRT